MEIPSYQKTKDKMAIGNHHISIITLNVSGPSSSIKRHRVADRIKNKTQPHAAFRRHISAARTNIDSSERVEHDTPRKWHPEKSR